MVLLASAPYTPFGVADQKWPMPYWAMGEFNEEGLPIGVHVDRFRDVNGTLVLTPWSGHSRDWKRVDGRLFPTRLGGERYHPSKARRC